MTDSAAAGTALATGKKTKNHALGMLADGQTVIYSVAQWAKDAGAAVGVTTSVSVDHATPAAFYAHVPERSSYYAVGKDLIRADYDFYAGSDFMEPTSEKAKGEGTLYEQCSKAGYVIARGYAVMSACYCEVSSDPDMRAPDAAIYPQEIMAYNGVFTLWGPRDPKRTDNITAIGAWGWALSRGLDLAERIPEIDAKKAVVTGCSRLGKSALMAAARDERFAVCVPNQTGGGGAPLAKRDYGENVSTENRMFTHWY